MANGLLLERVVGVKWRTVCELQWAGAQQRARRGPCRSVLCHWGSLVMMVVTHVKGGGGMKAGSLLWGGNGSVAVLGKRIVKPLW